MSDQAIQSRPELTGWQKPPFFLVNRTTGEKLYTTTDPDDLIAHWRQDQSLAMVNADGQEMGLISAAARKRS